MLYHDRKTHAKLPQHARTLYTKGFPGFSVSDMSTPLIFQDYSYGADEPKHMSAITQERFVAHFDAKRSLVIGCYSAPTDHQAFLCAGRMAHRALEETRSLQCISVMDICESWREIPPAMFYVIYGIDDSLTRGQNSSLRSFLYARDGSFRVLVMTGGTADAPWQIARNNLHIHLNGLIVLADGESPMQSGMISERANRSNRMQI